jgi:hypothetical protein
MIGWNFALPSLGSLEDPSVPSREIAPRDVEVPRHLTSKPAQLDYAVVSYVS